MKRIRFRHKQYQQPSPADLYPVNEKIRAFEVNVIDENSQNLGTMPTNQAIALAREKGFDLVAVAPKAVPPVCKFMDYGSFKYQKEKSLKKQKAQQKKIELKEIKLSPRIGEHDLEIRLNQSQKFLAKGDKVTISVFLKGRERQHPEVAREVIENFISKLQSLAEIKIEEPIKKMGNQFASVIAPGKKLD